MVFTPEQGWLETCLLHVSMHSWLVTCFLNWEKLKSSYDSLCWVVHSDMQLNLEDSNLVILHFSFWVVFDREDGIHLSAEGSHVVVKEILKVIKEAEWEPSLQWRSMPTEYGEDSPYDPIGPDGNNVNVSNYTFLETMQWE